jgi:hypothetical protein
VRFELNEPDYRAYFFEPDRRSLSQRSAVQRGGQAFRHMSTPAA